MNRRNKLVCGVGINDVENSKGGKIKQKLARICPYYTMWCSMLGRCYNINHLKRYPRYENCSVCDEWLTFSNFKLWAETQNWEGRHLDKDLLVRDNKVYSPETCCFISGAVNNFIIERNASRGEWPIGVSWHKRDQRFIASCGNPFTGKGTYIGFFSTPEEAHQAWLTRKLELAKLLAAEQDDPRVAKALVERYENYNLN